MYMALHEMTSHDMVHSCMVYTERAKIAAVLCSTSHVTVKQHCKYTTTVDIQKRTIKS